MKKGFTLVELIAVITVLALIALIAIPTIDKTLKEKKEASYNAQVENIISGAKLWANQNTQLLPDNTNKIVTIKLIDLKKIGAVDPEIKNPKTDEKFADDCEIKIEYKSGAYLYKFIDK